MSYVCRVNAQNIDSVVIQRYIDEITDQCIKYSLFRKIHYSVPCEYTEPIMTALKDGKFYVKIKESVNVSVDDNVWRHLEITW